MKVTDGAIASEFATSSASPTISVASKLTTPAAPTISANNLDQYGTETINGIIPSYGNGALLLHLAHLN